MKPSRSARSAVALGISASCAIVLVALCSAVAAVEHRGAHPLPDPDASNTAMEDGFPYVDWEEWRQVNPDIIGWITVPGTAINHPVVQAHADNPQFYLTHDVYRAENFTGCPYLDAQCEGDGLLRSRNAVVFGHNMGWNQDVFGDLECYVDLSFAQSHREVLLQTPKRKMRLRVCAATIIPGWEAIKRIDFASDDDFASWWKDRFSESAVKLSPKPACENLVTLCTCSYNRWQSERTLVYCQAE